jgi:Calx-beta domain
MTQSGSKLVAQIGEIDPGSSAYVTVFVMAPAPGPITQTASVVSGVNQLTPGTMSGSTTVNVLESPGILQFSASEVSVPDDAGLAQFVVTRADGSLGDVTVGYQTVSAGATPWLDYVATSGTLSFAGGQTSATIEVPVLDNPWNVHNQYVSVVLGSATGGATIGPVGTSLLQIIDIDPDHTPPEVSGLTWTGSASSITSLNVSFTAPLNQAAALNPANYQLVAPGLGNRVIPLKPQSYNGSSFSVTLVPSMALPSGQYYYIQIVGSGPSGIADIAGNFLDGNGNGQAGSNYNASFAQAKRLNYVDASGNKVSLKLTGAGYMEQVRNASGEGVMLNLVGIVPHHETLSGTVKGASARTVKRTTSARSTNLGTIGGLGNFGDVKVLLTSPPFFVSSYPFQRHGRGVL